jgi:hypothetical protein
MSDADCGSGTLRLRRTIPLLFGEKRLKTLCFDICTGLRFSPGCKSDRTFGAQELVTEHSSTKGIPKPPIRFTFYVVFAG